LKRADTIPSGQKVAILSPETTSGDLSCTVLWRKGIIRERITDIAAVVDQVTVSRPNLLVIDWPDEDSILSLVSALRAGEATRGIGIIVVSRTMTAAAEKACSRPAPT